MHGRLQMAISGLLSAMLTLISANVSADSCPPGFRYNSRLGRCQMTPAQKPDKTIPEKATKFTPVKSSCFAYRTKEGGDDFQLVCSLDEASCSNTKAEYLKNPSLEAIGCAPRIYCYTYNRDFKSSACFLNEDQCVASRSGIVRTPGEEIASCVANTAFGDPQIVPLPPPGATGINAFPALFDTVASGRSDPNAYLLAYLATAIYPTHLLKIAGGSHLDEDTLHWNTTLFKAEFEKATRHLFWNPAMSLDNENRPPKFTFITRDHNEQSGYEGYDPEAMVVDTPQAIFVVFRGTDRVANASGGADENGEWLETDFNFTQIPLYPVDKLPGKVHQGFWDSLGFIRNKLLDKLRAAGADQGKPVWITGHSLGAAHAQLFGALLVKRYNIHVQGIYAFAAPHVGDITFREQLNQLFPSQRLQRFEFIDDPVTMLPPYIFGYGRAGVRNHYNDVRTFHFAKEERPLSEDSKVEVTLVAVAGGGTETYLEKTWMGKFKIGNEFCYHHPTWYLTAAHNQLSPAAKSVAPYPLDMPTVEYEKCGIMYIAKAKGEPIAAKPAGDLAAELVKNVSYAADVVRNNATGKAIPEGVYRFRLNRGGLYLQHKLPAANGAALELASLRAGAPEQRWEVKRDGLVGYIVKSSGRFLDNAYESVWTDGGKVHLWEANLPGGWHQPNQQWSFVKVGSDGHNDAYVIWSNSAPAQALSGVSDDTNQGGRVVHSLLSDSNPLQVWIAERVN